MVGGCDAEVMPYAAGPIMAINATMKMMQFNADRGIANKHPNQATATNVTVRTTKHTPLPYAMMRVANPL
jgi:hypothetical protein